MTGIWRVCRKPDLGGFRFRLALQHAEQLADAADEQALLIDLNQAPADAGKTT